VRLIQFSSRDGHRKVGVIPDDGCRPFEVLACSYVRDLALAAQRQHLGLEDMVHRQGLGAAIDYAEVASEGRLLLPLDHPDPYRCLIAITGLTHLGSATSRDAMHARLAQGELTDSLRMFKLGLEGGRPAPGAFGVQPEWAYKGTGSWCVPPGSPIELPGYAEGGGEEAEIVGLYVISDGGEVLRVGYALGNEFSDHRMERSNYLYLAHSKLRQCSFGPELLVGELPPDIRGKVRVRRGHEALWEQSFVSGEANMCHSIANLEHHHFKYAGFRQPGDVHVYFLGASVLSFSDGITVKPGDEFEVECTAFGRALVNPLVAGPRDQLVQVIPL
jgi:hypothetical protein